MMPEREGVAAKLSPVNVLSDFAAFYEREHVRLYRSLLLLTRSREEAEDLSHEAFVRVLQRWERVAAMEAPSAYLYRTALNLRRNALRRLLRRAKSGGEPPEVQADASGPGIARAELFRVLGELSQEQREALVLVDFLGFTSQEAAVVLRIDPEAVRARLHRGRARVRKELIEHG
jgi:RNA polymerase sigma-70 factor (ECF subfamily)